MEDERGRLQEVISKMEARLNEQTRLLEQVSWSQKGGALKQASALAETWEVGFRWAVFQLHYLWRKMPGFKLLVGLQQITPASTLRYVY